MSEQLEKIKQAYGPNYHEYGYVNWLINRVEQLEAIRQFYADPTIYDAREGMAILKDCGDKAREGLK